MTTTSQGVTLGHRTTVVVQGDSLGYDNSVSTFSLWSTHTRWPDLVARQLGPSHTMYRVDHINTSYSETTSYSVNGTWTQPAHNPGNGTLSASGEVIVWDRTMSAMKADRTNGEYGAGTAPILPSSSTVRGSSGNSPDYHIIQFGTNDIYWTPSHTASTYEADISNRIADYPNAGRIVLALAWAPKQTQAGGDPTAVWDQYGAALDDLALGDTRIRVVKIPTALRVNSGTGANNYNDIPGHLRTSGAALFASYIYSALRS